MQVGLLSRPSVQLNHQPRKTPMTTTIQSILQWLQDRLQKPVPQKVTKVSKKDSQVQPTLPNQTRSATLSKEISAAECRVLSRL